MKQYHNNVGSISQLPGNQPHLELSSLKTISFTFKFAQNFPLEIIANTKMYLPQKTIADLFKFYITTQHFLLFPPECHVMLPVLKGSVLRRRALSYFLFLLRFLSVSSKN